MKKALTIALATAVCVSVVSCGQTVTTNTTGSTASTLGSTPAGTNQTTAATTIIPGMVVPTVDAGEIDPVTIDIEGYAKLIYNPACCEISYTLESGLGAKKELKLNIVMKKGYVFDGWSKSELGTDKKRIGGAISNGGTVDSTEATYSYTITKSKEMEIWANYSAIINYNPNGGTVANGDETYQQKFSMVMYKCPSTLPEQDYFKRDGYTLVEYNTKADGP